MAYLGEFRTNWRYLAAASVGQAAGYSVTPFINNIFIPHLIDQFDWSRSEIALVGASLVLGIVCQPVAGRLTDIFGVRRIAMIGVVSAPILYVALSAMTGALSVFFLLTILQVILVGGTTIATTYSRLIAQEFDRARGLALAIFACAPAAAGAVSAPILSRFIDTNGWRAGYISVAVCVGIAGLAALLLIPSRTGSYRGPELERRSLAGYHTIVRNPAFQLIVVGMLLGHFAYTMQASQLKVILLDQGIDSATGTLAISLFALGVIAGRFLFGIAFDRCPTHAVAAVSLALPGIGLNLLAYGLMSPVVIAAAVFMLGLSYGGSGTMVGYLAIRYFKLEIYSTVLGMIIGAVALSATTGALLLSLILKVSGHFTSFLILSAVAALLGACMLMLLGRVPDPAPAESSSATA